MLNKTALGLAIILAAASSALAGTKTYNVDPSHTVYTNVYNPFGAPVGTDPDLNMRLELKRDWGNGL